MMVKKIVGNIVEYIDLYLKCVTLNLLMSSAGEHITLCIDEQRDNYVAATCCL